MNSARRKLDEAEARHGAMLSVGLEPAAEYLPPGFSPDYKGYRDFLSLVIEATKDVAAAYKFNLAFFEALGPRGWELLLEVRRLIPGSALVIADAKRGDIGSTARYYATAVYDWLGADSVTINPLMGRDSAEPFLAYTDKLAFFLVLTSNPGAADFLLPHGLYLRMTRDIALWGPPEQVGFVVGATQPDCFGEVRALAPRNVFLVPGIGAQGGDANSIMHAGSMPTGESGLLVHATRSLLPKAGETGDAGELIARRAVEMLNMLKQARL